MVLVQKSIYATFLERFRAKAAGIRVGDPADVNTQLGPVISERSRQRILAMLERAKAAGAKVLTGGGVPSGLKQGFFIEPTVLYDVDPLSEIGQDEVFGPVTVVMPFDDEAHALRIANGAQFGLAASVWTQDVTRASGGEQARIRHGVGQRSPSPRSGVAVGRVQEQRRGTRDGCRIVRSVQRAARGASCAVTCDDAPPPHVPYACVPFHPC